MAHRENPLFFYQAKEIAQVCGVDISTARKWKRGASRPPPSALKLLSGDLGVFSAHWKGWVVRGTELISPEGWTTSRGDALSVPLLHGQIAALRTELRRAKEVLAMEEQPAPPEVMPVIVK